MGLYLFVMCRLWTHGSPDWTRTNSNRVKVCCTANYTTGLYKSRRTYFCPEAGFEPAYFSFEENILTF